jgi:hypothetical protein
MKEISRRRCVEIYTKPLEGKMGEETSFWQSPSSLSSYVDFEIFP